MARLMAKLGEGHFCDMIGGYVGIRTFLWRGIGAYGGRRAFLWREIGGYVGRRAFLGVGLVLDGYVGRRAFLVAVLVATLEKGHFCGGNGG